jgi:hypothetical protein
MTDELNNTMPADENTADMGAENQAEGVAMPEENKEEESSTEEAAM